MKKAICLIRVSTQGQNTESQRKEVIEFAMADGFKPKDILIIEDKESGYCLKEEEREGLNKLKEAIEDPCNDIKCVYVWEVSRIARKVKIIANIIDMLTEKKVNLKINEKKLSLFDDKGKVNYMMMMMLYFLGVGAEMERNTMIERMMRTKKDNAEKGMKIINKCRYGYSVDKDNYFQVNEEEAKVIRNIFEMYLSNEYSCEDIAKELNEKGIVYTSSKDGKFTRKEVNRILTFEPYSGEVRAKNNDNTIGTLYPQIVPMEMIKQAIEISKGKKNICKNANKYKAYCKGILKDANDMLLDGTPRTFSIDAVRGLYKNQITRNTTSMHYCDFIAWHCTKHWRMNNEVNVEEKAMLETQMQEMVIKMRVTNSNVDKAKAKIDRLDNDYYIKGCFDEAKYNKLRESLNNELTKLEANKEQIERQIENQTRLIKKAMKDSFIDESILESMSDDKKIELIHQVIKEIIVTKETQSSATLIIHFVDCSEQKAFYNSKKHILFIGDIDLTNEFVRKAI